MKAYVYMWLFFIVYINVFCLDVKGTSRILNYLPLLFNIKEKEVISYEPIILERQVKERIKKVSKEIICKKKWSNYRKYFRK